MESKFAMVFWSLVHAYYPVENGVFAKINSSWLTVSGFLRTAMTSQTVIYLTSECDRKWLRSKENNGATSGSVLSYRL
jgi:hypothetical protein